MVERERTFALNVRLAPAELRMLQELTESFGLSQSDVIRQMIRRTHEERIGAPKTRPKKK